MILKVNCERCGALLIKGKIFNFKEKILCEDCFVLLYLFVRKVPDAFSPDVRQKRHRVSAAVAHITN